jgi:hypothetical protein
MIVKLALGRSNAMAEQLSVEPCISIPISKSVAEAQAMLEEGKLVVIYDEDRPLALSRADDLAQLGDAPDRPLAEILSRFASPVLIDTNIISSDTLIELIVLLDERKVPGLIVYRNKQIEGVISQETLYALPLSDIPLPGDRREMYGNPQTPTRAYICHKCEQNDPPPPILLPSQGDHAPTCPKHWLHGSMTLLESEDE